MGKNNYKVYTPSKYAEIIINSALKNYFQDVYTKKKLDKLRVVDLSCGTGNLLCLMLEKLIQLSYEINGKYSYNPKWLKGYDLDKNAGEKYDNNIQKILKHYGLNGHTSFENSDGLLIENHGKYDIVLGNPPYIGEKNNKELFDKIKGTDFGEKYYESRMDYFYFFIEKAIEILKPNGILSYITTNYWLKADSGKTLRYYLRKKGKFLEINNFNMSVFEEAPGQHNIIFLWKKITDEFIYNHEEFKVTVTLENVDFIMNEKDLYSPTGRIRLIKENDLKFNKRIYGKSNYKLKELFSINQGIISGCDKAFVLKEYDERFKDYLKPLYKNKDILKYSYNEENKYWVLYIDSDKKIDSYLRSHLLNYREKLEKRREVKTGRISWYELQWARKEHIFLDEKIIVRQRCKTNLFAYSNKAFYGSADIYYLTPKEKSLNIFYVLGYLNSNIFYKWYKLNGKSKGYNLEFYATPLKEIPIYYPENDLETKYVEKLVKEQIKIYSDERQNKIDLYFRNLFK
ncbi:MAG: TaqI-like C-terminal specificity domain-containing protein [Fusobacterium sp. JB019]|nr:TaqI-like C-terminal specificity domain-containing protein [Fusobacterium sp. JB019]